MPKSLGRHIYTSRMVSNGSVRDKHQVPEETEREREREKETERERKRKRKRKRKRTRKRKRKRERERERERERDREKDLNLNEPHRCLEACAGTARCRGPRPSGSTRSADASHFTPGRGLQGVVAAAGHRTEPVEVRGHRSDKTCVASEAGGGPRRTRRAARFQGPGARERCRLKSCWK